MPVLTEQSLPTGDDPTNNCGEMQQFLVGPNVYSASTTMSSEVETAVARLTVEEHKDTIVKGGLLTFGDTSNRLNVVVSLSCS